MPHTYVQCTSPFLLVTISVNIYRICVIELILVFAVWKWKVVESELRRKNVEKFHPGIALRVYLRYTCANCIALKPRAIWITWFAKVNFVFQFDCNRGGSVRARRDANCSLRGASYELVAKLNFCSLNSFGIIISWHRASLRACFFHVRCIIAKFDVYEFLTLSTRFISGII